MASETLTDADFAKRVGIPLSQWLGLARRGAPSVRGKKSGDGRPWPQTLHWWIKLQVDDAARVVPDDANQTDFAAIIGISSRQVRNLFEKGLPSTPGKDRRVPIAKGVQWYVDTKSRELAGDDTDELEIEKLKKMRAERELAEINLASKRRNIMGVDDVLREVEEVFAGVHGVHRGLLDRASPRLVGLGDEASVREILEPELQKAATKMIDAVANYAARSASVLTEMPAPPPIPADDDGADSDDG